MYTKNKMKKKIGIDNQNEMSVGSSTHIPLYTISIIVCSVKFIHTYQIKQEDCLKTHYLLEKDSVRLINYT